MDGRRQPIGMQLLIVAIGGFVGSVARYLLAEWLGGADDGLLPWGTLTANVLGSYLLGAVAGFADRDAIGNRARLFLAVGLLGGFTTFSLFSYENLDLLRDERLLTLIASVSVQIGAGLGAAALGYVMSTWRR